MSGIDLFFFQVFPDTDLPSGCFMKVNGLRVPVYVRDMRTANSNILLKRSPVERVFNAADYSVRVAATPRNVLVESEAGTKLFDSVESFWHWLTPLIDDFVAYAEGHQAAA